MFHIVDFKAHHPKEKAVVPDLWLSINNTLCALPPNASSKELETMAQNRVEPGPGWQIFGISLLQTFKTYAEAKKELDKCREMSRSESEGPQRKRKKPGYLSEYSSQDNSDNDPASSSPTTIFKTEFLDMEDLSENEWIPPSSEVLLIPVGKEKESSGVKPRNAQSTPTRPSSQKETSDVRTSCKFSCHDTILQLLHNIQKQLEENNNLVKQLLGTTVTSSQPVSQKFSLNVPVTEIKGLQEIEDYLEDDINFEQCLSYFAAIGGCDTKHTLKRLLNTLISPEVAQQLNWKGRGDKCAFEIYPRIHKLIYLAAKDNPKCEGITLIDVEKFCKDWVRYAPIRASRLKSKLEAKMRSVEDFDAS